MHGDLGILFTLSVSLFAALVFGYITQRLKLSPILGYLLAGVAVGPQTPGVFADQETAAQFAELGVILLMFGVGLHFDVKDLLAVRRVAIPGAVGQIAVATALGTAAVVIAGLGWTAGIVVGLAISVASTVVLVRVLTDNDVLTTTQGHIAVGWLIVEDIFTVLVLVMLPTVGLLLRGGEQSIAGILLLFGLAIVKIAVLAASRVQPPLRRVDAEAIYRRLDEQEAELRRLRVELSQSRSAPAWATRFGSEQRAEPLDLGEDSQTAIEQAELTSLGSNSEQPGAEKKKDDGWIGVAATTISR